MADIALVEPAEFGLASVASAGAGAFDTAAMWPVAPGQWLAYSEAGSPDWADGLAATLAGRATVVDQSSAYAMWQITGADARRLLQKGLAVDLSALAPGAVVVSAIAHLGVIVHCAAADSLQVFVFRSFAASFREWLNAAIAGL